MWWRACAVSAVALACVVGAQAAAPTQTPSQVKKRFAKAAGEKVFVNKRTSYPGHYVAFDFGVETFAKKARYGTFTVYVVTAPDVAAQVTDLLADGHTGVLGKPARGGIHWESGTTIHGDRFWLAKRRYGTNVVLWWIGSKPIRKTDATWARLHRALVKATSS